MTYNHSLKKEAFKRIKDRHIAWKEKYTKRSYHLKRKYTRELGPNSYFRWEGHDYTTDSDYYVLVAPSMSEEYGKAFFAGIRKMPATYSPSGKYFRTIREALRYAYDRWDVRMPIPLPTWTSNSLKNIEISEKI